MLCKHFFINYSYKTLKGIDEFIPYCKRRVRQLRKSKVGVDSIAVQEFEDADADQSGELSVVEIFCLLPQVEKRFKMDLRSLAEHEEESDSGQ